MPLEFTDSQGQRHILDGRKWRPATEEEVSILDESVPEAAGRAAGASASQFGGLLQTIASFAPPPRAGSIESRRARQPTFEQAQQGIRQSGLGRIAEADRELEERSRLQGGATIAGQIGFEALAEVLPGGLIAQQLAKTAGRGAAKRLAGESAEEAAERIARGAADVADTAAIQADGAVSSDDIEGIGSFLGAVGGDSAGAMSRSAKEGLWSVLKRTPGLKRVLEGLEEFAATPRPITGDQQRLLDSGNAERLGFEFLPGQQTGNNMIAEGIKSQPFLADAFDPVLTANARNLENRVSNALGIEPGSFGRSTLGEADDAFEAKFQSFAADIGDSVTIPDELFDEIGDTALTTRSRKAFENATEEGARTVDGAQVLEMRSRMNKIAANLSQNNEQLAADNMYEAINELDGIIERSVGDPARVKNWRDTQQRWRVNIAANSQGVVRDDGSVSLKALSNAIGRTFKDDFRKNLFQRGDDGVLRNPDMPEDVADLLDYTRLSRAFESNLGDSGTASRLALQQLVSGGIVGYTKQRAAARFITDVLLDRPLAAEKLPLPGPE